MKLYSYFRSTSSWRVRIGLNLKGLKYTYVPVHLTRDGGQQHRPEFLALNPQGMVPALELEQDGATHVLTQSIAILEYLEEAHPTPRLLPKDLFQRAQARQLTEVVNSSIQPLQNLEVLRKVADELGGQRDAWAQHFISKGLEAFERLVQESPGAFAAGEAPTFADICLIPQLYSARRFGLELAPYPTCLKIEDACAKLAAFEAARPERQPDAET